MTHDEYFALTSTSTDPFAVHRAYYGQFVTPALRDFVGRQAGADVIKRAMADGDKHLNGIHPLEWWDRFSSIVFLKCLGAMRDAGEKNARTLSQAVCVAKEAARQYAEQHESAAV